MKSAHLICKSANGVSKADGKNTYFSGSWVIPKEEANELIGGRLYLHENKSEPSYFGGSVVEWRNSKREVGAIEEGVTFVIEADKDGKGARWKGNSHAMAWFSGIVDEL